MTDTNNTIKAYLDRLTAELKGSDPALIMDAVNDASEYLHNEVDALLEADPALSPQAAMERAVDKFGSPTEVAQSFREMEAQVNRAFGLAPSKTRRKGWILFFDVIRSPRAYSTLLFMIISFAISLIHLFWIAYGVPLALIAGIFIIGIPLCLLFTGTMRALALVEFRLTEVLLGERLPRRPVFVKSQGNLLARFMDTLRDRYTWKTLLYLTLMVPLGVLYGLIVLVGLGTVAELLWLPLKPECSDLVRIVYGGENMGPGPWGYVATLPLGFLVLVCLLHLCLYLGRCHGRFVKRLMFGPKSVPHSDTGRDP